jgi:hypothetical protein
MLRGFFLIAQPPLLGEEGKGSPLIVVHMTTAHRSGVEWPSCITSITWSSNHPSGGRKQAGPQTVCQ